MASAPVRGAQESPPLEYFAKNTAHVRERSLAWRPTQLREVLRPETGACWSILAFEKTPVLPFALPCNEADTMWRSGVLGLGGRVHPVPEDCGLHVNGHRPNPSATQVGGLAPANVESAWV